MQTITDARAQAGSMLANPKIKSKMGNKMNEGMVAPYQKALEQANVRISQK